MKRNTLISISILLASLAIVHSIDLLRTNAAAQGGADARAFLDRSVTAKAAGQGNPWISLRDGHAAPAQYQGSSKFVQQLKENQVRALSLASDDFDEDGVPDIVSGFSAAEEGVICLQSGDVDTIFPNTAEAIAHRAHLRASAGPPAPDDIQSPLLLASCAFDVPSAPDFLGTGDFDGDGHRDIVAGQRGSSELVLLSGDGRGGFAPPQRFALPGRVTALVTGDVNRIDGLADVLVAVSDAGASELLIYEGSAGALKAAPEIISLPSETTSIAIGQLDNSSPVDIGVAAGHDLLIVHGRDRKHSTADGKKLDAQPPSLTRLTVSFSIEALAIGDFSGDLRHEIALLSDDGMCRVFDRASTDGTSWKEASAVAVSVSRPNQAKSSRVLIPARLSISPKDDLLLLDQAGSQLQVVVNESAIQPSAGDVSGSPRLRVAGTLDVNGEPVAALGMRLNVDALNDLVVLSGNASTPTLVMTSAAMTFSVTNTLDSGPGSLRQAILDANSNPGADAISFNIPGPGTQTISPTSALPQITQPVTIDGTTQNPASTTPPIELAGNSAGNDVKGLSITGGGSTVRGLVINRFDGIAIELTGGGGDIVEGNYLGTDATGNAAQGNGESGVAINIGSGHRIGGTTAAARNVISSNVAQGVLVLGPAMNNLVQGNFIGTNAAGAFGLGNSSDGIELVSGSNTVINCTVGGTAAGARNVISANNGAGVQFISVGTNNLVQGNFIGTDVSGSNDLGNGSSGVAITEADNSTIGGTVPGAGNVISGNGSNGVRINSSTATSNRVQGNKIGTRADSTTQLPNDSDGILFLNSANNNTIGGAAGEGNIIAFNLGNGVMVDSGAGNAIQANSIFSNAGLGIDLAPAGVTPNDSGDGDGGANNLQNFPVLTTANGASGGGVNIQGTLNSTASTTFTLEFFSSSTCDPSGNGEGQTFLGSASAMTNASGNASFNVILAASASSGQSITSTATSPLGDTSEFSACVPFVVHTLTVASSNPSSGVSITVSPNDNDGNGNGVTQFTRTYNHNVLVTLTAPATVGSNTFLKWQLDGVDYTANQAASLGMDANHTMTAIYAGGPDNAVFVSQSAVPQINPGQSRTISVTMRNIGVTTWTTGAGYKLASQNPQDNTTWGLNRVDLPSPVAPDADVTFTFNITAPATGGTYNFQWQMIKEGTGLFGSASPNQAVLVGFFDVPPGYLFYTDINKIAVRGITVGCGGGNYCPESMVTREQMAAFIIRALGVFNPPPPSQQRFADVPPSNVFYAFIEEMAVRGITVGCGTNGQGQPIYCPSSPVTREQMAAFILRALGEFNPPTPPSQRYEDVPPSNGFYNSIDRMAVLQITFGCSTNPPLYCPSNPVTRGQMAAFLSRAFGL